MRKLSLALLLLVACAFVACESKEKSAVDAVPAPDEKAEKVEPAEKDEPAAKTAPADGVRDYDKLADDDWCKVAHEETVKLVEGIKTSMKENGQPNDYEVAPLDEYVETCRKLPKPMQKCVAIGYAQRHEKECREHEKALAGDDRANYKALMGK